MKSKLILMLSNAIIALIVCSGLASCSGGGSSLVATPTPTPTPLPTPTPTPLSISTISPSSVASGSPDTIITVNGTGFVAASTVLVNATKVTTTFKSSSQLSAVVPGSLFATSGTLQVSVTNSASGGGASGNIPLSVVLVASLSLFATPAPPGSATGPWVLNAVALGATGTPLAGLPIALAATAGDVTPTEGLTDSKGRLISSITPPPAFDPSQPVAITATIGAQRAAVNVQFQALTAAAAAQSATGARQSAATAQAGVNTLQPFSFGTAGAPSSTNPFATPDSCYTNAALTAPLTTNCQQVYAQNNLQPKLTNIINQACSAFNTITDVASQISCVGTALTVTTCVLGGELICAGILAVPGAAEASVALLTDCVSFLSQKVAEHFLGNIAGQLMSQAFILLDPADPANLITEACNVAQDLFPPSPGNSGGRVYVADSSANLIKVYDSQGTAISVAGSFLGLSTPDGMAYDSSSQHIYVANLGNNTVTVYDLDGNTVDLGPTAFAGLNDPEDIAFNPFNKHLYINEPSSNQILVFDESGNAVTLAAGAFANLNLPFGLGWDSTNGLIYVTNAGNNTMNVYDQDGNQKTTVGTFPGLNSPDDVSWDPLTGNLYVTGVATNPFGACVINQVFVYTPDGNPVSAGFAGLNGPDAIVSNGDPTSPLYYVTNICGGSVSVFDKNGGPVTLPAGAFGNLVQPTGVLVVP